MSRRLRNSLTMRVTSCSTRSSLSAVAAANCAGWLAPVVECDCSAAIAFATLTGARQMHDLRIRDPGRCRNRDDIAGTEEREAGVEQRLLGAVRDDDVIGVDGAAARQQREMGGRGGS